MILAEDPVTHQHPLSAEHIIHPSLTEQVEEQAQHWSERLKEWWHYGALGLVALHTTYGTWEVVHFLLIEYPRIETELVNHAINSEEVNFLIARAIVRSVLTIVNAAMTVRLHSVREKIASTLDLVFATLLIAATPVLQYYLERLEIVSTLAELLK